MLQSEKLREARAKLIADARTVIDSADTLDAEQRQQVDTMLTDADDVRKDIKRVEAIEAEECDLREASDRRSKLETPKVSQIIDDEPLTTSSPAYRGAFDAYLRKGHRRMDGAEKRALEAGTVGEGGYLVPSVVADTASMVNTIIETIDDGSAMYGLSTVINVSGDTNIPVESTLGTANWVAEEADIQADGTAHSDAAFGRATLSPQKAATMLKASSELLSDNAVNLESYIGKNFGRRFANLLEDSFITGSGSGQPNGIDNTSTLGVTFASPTAPTFDEMIEHFYKPKEGYRRNGTWVMNSGSALKLHQLKDDENRYLWQSSLEAGTPDTIMGRPVAISDSCDNMVATKIAVFFGDISYYWIAQRQGIVIKRLDELYSETDQVGFLATLRIDGELTLAESVHHMKMAAS